MNSNFHQVLTATQIAALILSKVKELVETKLNVPMKNIVLATPAHFTDAQIQATREAAKLAGLNLLKMVDEPTAVVLACYEDETDSKTLAYFVFIRISRLFFKLLISLIGIFAASSFTISVALLKYQF